MGSKQEATQKGTRKAIGEAQSQTKTRKTDETEALKKREDRTETKRRKQLLLASLFAS